MNDALFDPADQDMRFHTVCVDASQAGMRLDKLLSIAVPDLSRARARTLIEEGLATRNGVRETSASRKALEGDSLEIGLPEASGPDPEPQNIPLCVLYEDSELIVIDKPAGMVTHPAPGSLDGTLVNALLYHCKDSLSGINGVRRPGIVHRLDKDTSGVMVAAKTDRAHRALAEQFAAHNLTRAYLALCWGSFAKDQGEIEGNIGRNPHDRKKMAIVSHGGKYAKTHYRVRKRFGDIATLIECRLDTGRTHQIRVHMTSIGHPLIGDPVYGAPPKALLKRLAPDVQSVLLAFPRQALHAWKLGFTHPLNCESVFFKQNLPQDINDLLYFLDEI